MRARENPLRSERVESVAYRPFEWTWDLLDARLRELNFRCAIVGPEGCGKTTLLEELERRFAKTGLAARRIMLRRDERTFAIPRFDPDELVFLDGAEQLSTGEWTRFARLAESARGLIITSHRAGLLPTLVNCSATAESLGYVLSELLTYDQLASLGAEPARLLVKHRGNIRLVLWELYDQIGSSEHITGGIG